MNYQKTNTMIDTKDGSHYIEYYYIPEDKSNIKWFPLKDIANILNIEEKVIKKNVGKHAIATIHSDNDKEKCVDALSLVRLNRIVLDTKFYNSIIANTVWREHYFYKLNDIENVMPTIKGFIDNNKYYETEVGFYDRLRSDVYHVIENTNENKNDELKTCLSLRRKAKSLKQVSDTLLVSISSSSCTTIEKEIKTLLNANESKKYKPRLNDKERDAWKEKYRKKKEEDRFCKI